jgi:hypothetical protein
MTIAGMTLDIQLVVLMVSVLALVAIMLLGIWQQRSLIGIAGGEIKPKVILEPSAGQKDLNYFRRQSNIRRAMSLTLWIMVSISIWTADYSNAQQVKVLLVTSALAFIIQGEYLYFTIRAESAISHYLTTLIASSTADLVRAFKPEIDNERPKRADSSGGQSLN